MSEDLSNPKNCLNCGEKLTGNFCSNCGQENSNYSVSFWKLVIHFFVDYFGLDSKLFRSIFPLMFKPGFLTNEYNGGKRTRYILPLRMYIFFSVLFFFIYAFKPYTGNEPVKIKVGSDSKHSDSLVAVDDSSSIEFESEESNEDKNSFTYLLGQKVKKKINETGEEEFKKSFISSFKKNLPKMMFILLPIFALILKILYVRSKRLYFEHLIFSLHFHSFAFLFLSVTTLLEISFFTNESDLNKIFLLIVVYLYIALKKVYKQSFLKTFFKTFLLVLMYALMLGLSFALLSLIIILFF